MLALLPIFFAAICKALADTLDHHFDTSIFRSKPRKWWDPNVIIKSAPQILGYPLDVWHVINSIQLTCWLVLPFIYVPSVLAWYWEFLIGGGLFILVFNIFYNKIFR